MRYRLAVSSSVLALALAGCDDRPHVFSSMDECRAQFSQEKCERYVLMADDEHAQTAPKYARKEDCESAHADACTRRVNADGASVWMPAMMGFIVGRALSGSAYGSHGVYYASPGQKCDNNQSCVRGGGNGAAAFMASRGYAGSAGGFARAPSPSMPSIAVAGRPGAAIAARGGFGMTAAAHGGGGGE